MPSTDHSNQTSAKPRHTKQVRHVRDGEIGISLDGTEYVMPASEALALSGMVMSIVGTKMAESQTSTETLGALMGMDRVAQFVDESPFYWEVDDKPSMSREQAIKIISDVLWAYSVRAGSTSAAYAWSSLKGTFNK